ncbi:MAG TPA: GlsB/YeaQ/YmgE family stress response membrane protein [Polyangiaceae bacterium]
MTITLTGLVVLLIIAGLCGAVGRLIAGGMRGGFVVSIAVGFVGAFLGTFVARSFHLPEVAVVAVDGHAFPILWSIVGAAVFVGLAHLISRNQHRQWRHY